MGVSIIKSNLQVDGHLSAQTMTVPSSSVGNSQVKSSDLIDYDKMEHMFAVNIPIANNGSDVASVTKLAHIVRKAGTLVAVEACAVTAPTGGDKKFTVDVQNGDESTAFATVLSAVIDYSSTQNDKEVEAATVSAPTLVDGDLLKIIVTASGSTGSQAQEATVTLWIAEDAA